MHLPATGQTTCWDADGNAVDCPETGQDGELREGVSWPTPRFSPDGEGAVIDHLTGLVWMRDANLMPTRDRDFDGDGVADGSVTWQNALDYVGKLNQEKHLGYSDWRLPNIREIRSLIHYASASPRAWLNETGQFINVQDGYWSATTSALSRGKAWTVAFPIGSTAVADKNEARFVWPLRGGEAGTVALPRTGQQTCWNATGEEIGCKFPVPSKQDGDFRMGEPWPSPRFIVSGRTVLDGLTNLLWTRDASLIATKDPDFDGDGAVNDGSVSWQNAFAYIDRLNRGKYLGYSDWRLPNIHEMESLISFEINYLSPDSGIVLSVAEWLASKGFTGARESCYWSSSSLAGDARYAWGLNMYAGYLDAADKAGTCSLWPVRDASRQLGDINGDFRVDLTDAVLSLQLLVRIAQSPVREGYASSGADVNGDGRVGLAEVIHILRELSEGN